MSAPKPRPSAPTTPRPSPPGDAPEPGAALFVWGVWAAMSLAAVGFVAAFGADVPISEDFGYVPVLTGERPLTVGWLWSWVNEFRFPLTKLVLVAAFRLTGLDFRAGLYLSVASLGLVALGLILAARRDAFFPLVCLNWGHHTCFLWNSAFVFVGSTALGTGLLLLIVRRGGRPSAATAAAAAVGFSLLPLVGPMGLAFMPALAVWLGSVAASHGRSGGRSGRLRGLGIAALSAPGLALAVLYFRGFERPPHHSPPGGPADVARTTLQFLSLGFGPAAADLWPLSGVAVPCLLVLATALLLRAWAARPEERPRALGLLAFLAATVSLALGLGWGRSGMGEVAGFQGRYSPLPVPTLCAVYLAVELYAGPAARRFVLTGLLLSTTAVLWGNTAPGLKHGRENAAEAASIRRDVREGLPAYLVVKRHTPFLHPSHDELGPPMAMLKKAGVGPFRFLKDNPAFTEEPVPLTPSQVRLLTWKDGTAHVTGVEPWVTFALPQPRYVAGIRLRYTHANRTATSAHFKIAWKRPAPPSPGSRPARIIRSGRSPPAPTARRPSGSASR